MFAIALLLTAQAPMSPMDGTQIRGAGAVSCATAFTSSATYFSTQWILGFATGLLAMNEKNHFDTDNTGLVAEVKKVCDEKPPLPLARATVEALNHIKPIVR